MYTNKIKEIAHRMSSPDKVREIVIDKTNRNPDPPNPQIKQVFWQDLSLSEGYAAPLLLFSQLDYLFPNEKWDAIVHNYILKIKESIEQKRIDSLSLFGGLAGCCLAVGQVSGVRGYYKKLYNTLVNFLIKEVRIQYLIPFEDHLKKGTPVPPSLYENIQGLAGIGVSALCDLANPALSSLLQEIIRLLVLLTKPISINGRSIPGWYVLPDHMIQQESKLLYPQGNFNLGLSHGVTGVLAFLSIAFLHKIQVPGQKEAIKYFAAWLNSNKKIYNDTFFWEGMISLDYESKPKISEKFSSRDAWCYGTPGVANTLYLAGRALEDKNLRQNALNDFQSLFKRTPLEWKIPGPTLCHGIGGLLLITQLLANHSKEKKLLEKQNMLKIMLYECFHQDHPFGFKDVEPKKNGGWVYLNKSGLLEGATGSLLTLLSLENKTSWWHAPFLIGTE